MPKKFYVWVVLSLLIAIASTTAIHWKAIEGIGQRTAKVLPLYQRLKVLESLSLGLEQYRRVSSGFRNLEPAAILEVKDQLVKKFDDGIAQLDRLAPGSADLELQGQLKRKLTDLLESITEVEPTLFSRDAYVKPQIQALQDDLLKTLSALVSNADRQVSGLHLDGKAPEESRSLAVLIAVQLVILALSFLLILQNYVSFQKPLKSLHQYAHLLKEGKPVDEAKWNFKGLFDDIHAVLSKLSVDVDTLVKNRHRFMLDLVEDLKGPLEMLSEGKLLLEDDGAHGSSEQKLNTLDTVRRGVAICSGSLEDLHDIVGINQLQSRLVETTVDLSELLTDVSRVLFGSEAQRRMVISVPPIPVWVTLDVRRFERGLFQMISKVASTLRPDAPVLVAVSYGKGSFRGVELVVQGAEDESLGVPAQTGPEQELTKHWMSESGLSMRLVQKMIKSHGGSVTAAGIAGSSVRMVVRIPYERVSATGLIAPPSGEVVLQRSGQAGMLDSTESQVSVSGLVFKAPARVEKEETSVG